MELISKNQDLQGNRYHLAGSFKLIEEDWMDKKITQKIKQTEKENKEIQKLLKEINF